MPCQYVGKASMMLNGISAAFKHKSQESLSSLLLFSSLQTSVNELKSSCQSKNQKEKKMLQTR
jgi:hypothetical protein